jgi:hypothetical protein
VPGGTVAGQFGIGEQFADAPGEHWVGGVMGLVEPVGATVPPGSAVPFALGIAVPLVPSGVWLAFGITVPAGADDVGVVLALGMVCAMAPVSVSAATAPASSICLFMSFLPEPVVHPTRRRTPMFRELRAMSDQLCLCAS